MPARTNVPNPRSVIQPKWDPSENEGILRWDKVMDGLQWFYNMENNTMFFEVQEEDKIPDPRMKNMTGPAFQKGYDNWVLLFNQMEILDANQTTYGLLVPVLTAKKGDYTADETLELIDFINRQPGSEGINYLLKEFAADPKISSYLSKPATADIIGRAVSKSEARKLEGKRLGVFRKIYNRLPPPDGRQEVLMLGGSKDFVFPFLITGGRAQRYHMVSGEIGNAEAIRKTIALYSPANPTVGINTTEIADGVRSFMVALKDDTVFQVVSYDMLYEDFFELQKNEGRDLNIPDRFDVVTDQMSWVPQAADPAFRKYTASQKVGGSIVSDIAIGGNFKWVLDLLGLEQQATDWDKDEYWGYGQANIYRRTGEADENAGRFHSNVYTVLTHAKNISLDLDTDEGLAGLAENYQDQAERLISELDKLISAFEKDPLMAKNPVIKGLRIKRTILNENLPEEEKEDPAAIEKEKKDHSKWLEENAGRDLSASDLFGRFKSTDSSFTLANVALGKIEPGMILTHRILPGVNYRITSVINETGKPKAYKIVPE